LHAVDRSAINHRFIIGKLAQIPIRVSVENKLHNLGAT